MLTAISLLVPVLYSQVAPLQGSNIKLYFPIVMTCLHGRSNHIITVQISGSLRIVESIFDSKRGPITVRTAGVVGI